jgi:hypothetical protein
MILYQVKTLLFFIMKRIFDVKNFFIKLSFFLMIIQTVLTLFHVFVNEFHMSEMNE